MENLHYEQDVSIDPNALDVEWVKQAELMGVYTKHAADMKKELDEAKERLDVGRARIEMDIRNNPAAYDLNKITEGAIQSTVILQEEHQKLVQAHTNSKYEYDIALAAVRAVDQKKTALENLVKLLGQSYFAGPQAPRDLSQEWIKERERKEKNAKVKIQRRKERSKAE